MEAEAPVERTRRPLGPILAWVACAAWAAYWIYEEATAPPPEPFPAWLRELLPFPPWEIPVLLAGALIVAAFPWYALRMDLRWRFRVSRGGSEAFAAAAAAWILLELAMYEGSKRGVGETFGLTLWFLVPFAILGVGLAWPVSSGVEGRRAQVALGLTRGRGILWEAGLGLLAVPAVLAGQALWEVLVRPEPGRPHPMDEWLFSGDIDLRTYATLATVVQAPLVEECGFRGIVYRFLRDSTAHLPRAAGVGAAVLSSSFLFAVPHPYGWSQVPPLMLFGAVACLLREWRGSIVAPIALHFGFNAFLLIGDVVEGRL